MTEEVWEDGTIDDWTLEKVYEALGAGLVIYIYTTATEFGYTIKEVIRFVYKGLDGYIIDQILELVNKAIEMDSSVTED